MATKTTAQLLEEARTAYHDIMTGQSVSRWIDQNGESVQYFKANIVGLRAYIKELEAKVADATAIPYSGPIKFTFGRRGC